SSRVKRASWQLYAAGRGARKARPWSGGTERRRGCGGKNGGRRCGAADGTRKGGGSGKFRKSDAVNRPAKAGGRRILKYCEPGFESACVRAIRELAEGVDRDTRPAARSDSGFSEEG